MRSLANSGDQMKCRIMRHFIRVYTVCYDKYSLHEKKTIYGNYNLRSISKYNGPSQVYCIKPKGKIHLKIETASLEKDPVNNLEKRILQK